MLILPVKRFLFVGGHFFGALFLFMGLIVTWSYYQTSTWNAYEAVITQSNMSCYKTYKGGTICHTSIYVISKKEWDIQKRIDVAHHRFFMGISSKAQSNIDLRHYPIGKNVIAYQNPNDTEEIVLERRTWLECINYIGLGILFFIISWFLKIKRDQA